MTKYKLVKELPTFEIGDKFFISNNGNLCLEEEPYIIAYSKSTLKKYPHILTEWFEEIPEGPKMLDNLKDGDQWWYIFPGSSELLIYSTHFIDGINIYRNLGLAFLTREDAEKELARRKAKQILLRDTKGLKPNWKDENQKKWFVRYNHIANEFATVWDDVNNYSEVIYYHSETDAKASLNKHRLEYLTLFGVEE